ncbi:hypothetical protein BDY19DRAFT_935038 [Irpex rosettiformis]|uniref:Uncharacterized protein n=1 Tax=Irpex rosettiformis TaxID=378272 RepID=A0ACB8UAU8_9APHY|nr:hypothetical protein BDY19DRAFT_935038 [Irpex rosettiformis]
MATTARQPKPPRKGMADPPARRPSAWTSNRPSPTYSPGPQNARLPGGPQGGGFPPLAQQGGAPRADRPFDRVLQQLSGLTGTTITLSTKSAQRYEGVIASTGGEGDTTGVTLKDVKEISSPGQPLKDHLFIAATNIDTWSSGPADAKAPNGDTFKTDTDISKNNAARERPLQAWADDIPENTTASGRGGFSHSDDLTFGPGASTGTNWDQFAVNEKLFGVKAGFDEEAYTTKLDRSAPDFKEKEKKAQQLANEIMSGTATNSHIAEERVKDFVGENGTTEEEKYGAVVRSANAYVPPGARKAVTANSGSATPTTTSVPKVHVNGPDGVAMKEGQKPTSPTPGSAAANVSSADPLPAFRNFVTNEKDRLMKKKQALMKSEMDKRMAELKKFSLSFKLNKPIPEDLVTILAKDEEKQKQIREKSNKDAESAQARSISAQALTTSVPLNPSATATHLPPATAKLPASGSPQPGANGTKPVGLTKTSSSASATKESSKRISMVIQAIPPFKGRRAVDASVASHAASPAPIRTSSITPQNGAAGPNTPLSPGGNRLNVNASSFKPINKNALPASTSSASNSAASSSSPKPKTAESSPTPSGPPNPFFGTRTPKKGPPIHVKDDFNPFKYHKVADASQVSANWPYSGKRYMQLFPSSPAPPQQSPHMPPPIPPAQMPPPAYEENSDPNGQNAPRPGPGYVYAYPPYGYPGQYPMQPMMPGVAPPPGHMQPFMPPIPYPYMAPPNAMYPGTPMGQMPPPQAYMPPPGAYPPPPNSAGPRPSMPPTPIPSHAHPYYHQSPQLVPHAIPYPMMMPPPGAPGAPPMQYEGQPAPPVQMQGGHA